MQKRKQKTQTPQSSKPPIPPPAQPATINPQALLRLRQIVPALIPVSRSKFWDMVKKHEFPQPLKISEAITAWRGSDIIAWLESKVASHE